MREPNTEDAKLLLQLETIRYSPEIDKAFRWAYTHWGADQRPVPPANNPVARGEAEEAVGRVSTFFETAGVLVRDGLLHDEIFYDRYAVAAFWKLAKEFNEAQRKETGVPAMGENFEWLAAHEPEAQARVDARHRRLEKERKAA